MEERQPKVGDELELVLLWPHAADVSTGQKTTVTSIVNAMIHMRVHDCAEPGCSHIGCWVFTDHEVSLYFQHVKPLPPPPPPQSRWKLIFE